VRSETLPFDETDGPVVNLASYQLLRDRLGLTKDIPYTPQWSAAADFLELIVEHALCNKPQTIVECGCGLTTVMLARCCALNAAGKIYSLENGADYARHTQGFIQSHELQAYSNILHAPLRAYQLQGKDFQWYNTTALVPDKIDMLVIDGPPGFLQRHSRYPALPLLYSRLHSGSVLFLDDAARNDEKELVAMWQAEYTALKHRYLACERGCSILQFTS
jgi:predicted O-methyltransferase YrrM